MQEITSNIDQANRLLIFDTSSIAWRNWHVFTINQQEENGHIRGSLVSFCTYIKKFSNLRTCPIYAIDNFPRKRVEIFPEYKAQRKNRDITPKPDVIQMIQYFPGVIAQSEDEESDDVIMTLVEKYKDKDIYIFTTDGDIDQALIHDNVGIVGMHDAIKDKNKALTKWGISDLSKLPLLKSLLGDDSDNIPKVPRLKTAEAITLTESFQDVKDLYEKLNMSSVSEKTKQLLWDYRGQVEKCYLVASRNCDVPLRLSVNTNKKNLEQFLDQKKVFNGSDFRSRGELISQLFLYYKEAQR